MSFSDVKTQPYVLHVNRNVTFTGAGTYNVDVPPMMFPVKKIRVNVAYLVQRDNACFFNITSNVNPDGSLVGTIGKLVYVSGANYVHIQGLDDRNSIDFIPRYPLNIGGTYQFNVQELTSTNPTALVTQNLLIHIEFSSQT